MRTFFFIAIILLISIHVKSTEWYGHYYEFPYFQYKAQQLLGSTSKVPDMFPTAVKLNWYVKSKIESGDLKNKPVIYDIYDYNFERQRYLLEIYETNNAYHISINYRESYQMHFNYKELIKIIDYFAHPEFEPFYCDTNLTRITLTTEIFFNKINPLVGEPAIDDENGNILVYTLDSFKIIYTDKKFRIFWDNEDLNITVDYPISIPVKFRNRIIFMNQEYFYVFEDKKCIKKVATPGILWDIQDETNKPTIKIYTDWMDIFEYDTPRYSYSYQNNRLYKVDN